MKSFEFPKSVRNYEKNNAWNIRCLVDESLSPIDQASQSIILKIDFAVHTDQDQDLPIF